MPRLLSIVELGGYPNLGPLYASLGFAADVVVSQRKARQYLKRTIPDVIVAEFNFQSDFRDRSSNLETLMAVVERHPQIRVVVLYMPEHEERLRGFAERTRVYRALPLPLDTGRLADVLREIDVV